jgi:predicted hydrolase (HD superfamily)
MTPSSRAEAKALLQSLGAPRHLLRHVDLVGEAADQILVELRASNIKVNEQFILVGVALHDVGKIKHPSEMTAPGSNHEPTGEEMLLAAGASPEIARVSLSHARWSQMPVSLEELIVALADKLWKGVRVPELENMVISECANRSKQDYWQLFVGLDSSFEQIADHGSDRLGRSVS